MGCLDKLKTVHGLAYHGGESVGLRFLPVLVTGSGPVAC
jgi:hypothetical protein